MGDDVAKRELLLQICAVSCEETRADAGEIAPQCEGVNASLHAIACDELLAEPVGSRFQRFRFTGLVIDDPDLTGTLIACKNQVHTAAHVQPVAAAELNGMRRVEFPLAGQL